MATSFLERTSTTAPVSLPAEVMPTDNSREGPTRARTQSRQLLSCIKCRERKVKCDRTKPCTACCARGHPRECQFLVGEGNDYSPIQQSYEIRMLRLENQRLRARLRAARLSHSGDEHDEDDDDGNYGMGGKISARAAAARQRRFRTGDRIDNLYFGSPGLANIVSDFASLQLASQQIGNHSLTHTISKLAHDMYTTGGSMYPFQTLWTGSSATLKLVQVLPAQEELFALLGAFQKYAQMCSFPHMPDAITTKEVERFLVECESNAERHPDMLALIFIALATGLQMGQHERSGGEWDAEAMDATRKRGDVYLAASMHALRLASYMNQPTILGIQTLVIMGPYLTNSGRFLDAFALFGVTIRIAHSIGLHRNPKILEPAPPLRESLLRRTLWWWMLHMDQHYSVTLGRPLGISGFGDCPPPEQLTTNPTILRLGEFVDHFTILARQILCSDRLTNVAKIDDFTDKFIGLWDTMPEALQFNESWLQSDTPLPDWPLDAMSAILFAKVQSFLILLNRQRVERTQNTATDRRESSPPSTAFSSLNTQGPSPAPTSSTHERGNHRRRKPPVRGRELVINSSIQLLQVFLFFHHRNPAVLISWSVGQLAFNAAMILILDAWETENDQNEWLINQAYAVFCELENHRVHMLASLAVHRISEGLVQLEHGRIRREHQVNSRRASMQHTGAQSDSPQLMLNLDTAPMTDWAGDTIMGNTGMFLLEGAGLQSYRPSSFQPLPWAMAGSDMLPQGYMGTTSSMPSVPETTVPVSKVTAAPFPVVASAFISPGIAHTSSPYAVGFQHHMQGLQPRRSGAARRSSFPYTQGRMSGAFSPTNTSLSPGFAPPYQQQRYPQQQNTAEQSAQEQLAEHHPSFHPQQQGFPRTRDLHQQHRSRHRQSHATRRGRRSASGHHGTDDHSTSIMSNVGSMASRSRDTRGTEEEQLEASGTGLHHLDRPPGSINGKSALGRNRR